MNRRFYRFAFAPALAATAWLASPSAFANGRFPAADQLIIDPSDPTHIVVRTTFGFVETHDNGKNWLWTCEEIIGGIANSDPPFTVTGDGTVVVAVPFEGVSITHDHGCTWSKAPAPLAKQLAVDVTLEPNDPSSLIVLTSTNDTPPDAGPNAPAEFLSLVAETKDNGLTWALRGTPLPRDFIAATVEIAPSDPERIYASGVFSPVVPPDATSELKGALERSEDGGKTWTRSSIPTPSTLSSVYISAVDAKNPDRIFARVLEQADVVTNVQATTLIVTNDKGDTWKELAKTGDAMLGFALSLDSTKVAYGSIAQGVMLGPSDGSAPFVKVSDIQNRCLTWSPAGLYACNTDLILDPMLASGARPARTDFAVGLTHDLGATYDTIYRLFQTCPTECPTDSTYNKTCRTTWLTKPGVVTATHATGATCTVEWAKMDVPDGGDTVDAGRGGAGGSADSGGDATTNVTPPAKSSCSCRLPVARDASHRTGALGSLLIGVVLWSRRARRRAVGDR
jgi:photosystem II stability/assembly factor-like uncharacterized protein